MNTIRFKRARDLVNNMNAMSKRVWVSADDPKNLMFKVVDENLEYVFEIGMSHFKTSGHLLDDVEKDAFQHSVNRWKLIKDLEIIEHQKFLISYEYYEGMANYLRGIYNRELVNSKLRLNGILRKLEARDLSILHIDLGKIPYCFAGDGEELIQPKVKDRICIPLFEVPQLIMKRYDTIWDLKVSDFIGNNEILEKENNYYERIVNEIGEKVEIVINSRHPLIVLPVTDWAKGEMGFTFFICIGIGIFK